MVGKVDVLLMRLVSFVLHTFAPAGRRPVPRRLGRTVPRLTTIALVAGVVLFAAPTSARAADTTAPSEPGTITVSNVTATGASLKWGGSTDDVGIEGYRVYRGPASGGVTGLSLIATTDAVTSYTATSLRSNFSYEFGIVAIDASNNKSLMRTATLTTTSSTDTTAPAAPGSVSLAAFSSTRVDVIWGASTSTDVAYYQVYRTTSAGTALVGTIERPNSQRFSDNGLTASTSYGYTIKAVDSAGNSSPATTAKSATTLAAAFIKIARGPYLSNVTGTSAVISWWTNIPTTGSVSINGGPVSDSGTVQHHTVTVGGLTAGSTYS